MAAASFGACDRSLTGSSRDYIIRNMSNYRKRDLDQFAASFKALSSPQRLQIFLRLAACCRPAVNGDAHPEAIRCCVGDLGAGLGLSPSTVSHHLKELRLAGLMRAERRGQKIECRISEDAVRLLAAFLGETTVDGGSPGVGSARGGRTG